MKTLSHNIIKELRDGLFLEEKGYDENTMIIYNLLLKSPHETT